MTRWTEVADRVFARRYDEFDLCVGLVVGDERCLVVDTRSDPAQGAELAAAVRAVTDRPWDVVITHDHFDHCLGTAAFLPADVWAHPGCRESLAAGGRRQHEEALACYAELGVPDVPWVDPVVPGCPVVGTAVAELGGRTVELRAPGPGHTDHDVVVWVPDARALFAGDLVEEGGPPDFTDAVPTAWPGTLERLIALEPTAIVPGHGAVVDAEFVAAQRNDLASLAALLHLPPAEVLRQSPFDEPTTRLALRAHARRRI